VRRALPLAALAAGAALLAAALLHDGGVDLPRVERVEAAGVLEGEGRRFGDPVEGRVDVLVPRAAVDPGSVALEADFAPYALAAPLRAERRTDGPTALVRFRFRLECLEDACLPRHAGAGFSLAPGVVRWAGPGGRGSALVGWPPVEAGSWLDEEAGLLGWHTGLEPLPAIGYRLPPRLLAALLALLAVALGAGAAALLLPWARRTLPAAAAPVDRRSVLDRALAAVRTSAGGDDPAERRRALDLLARELRHGARTQEARDARRLAWSRRAPRRGDMEELADRVEGAEA
jgi:hypothetical protein